MDGGRRVNLHTPVVEGVREDVIVNVFGETLNDVSHFFEPAGGITYDVFESKSIGIAGPGDKLVVVQVETAHIKDAKLNPDEKRFGDDVFGIRAPE